LAGREQVAGAQKAQDCGICTETTEDNKPYVPNEQTGVCEPPAPDSFDETKCVEETYFNENKADCEAAGYVNCEGGENSQAQETTGGIIKGTLDDCNVIQDPQCIGDGRWNGEKCVCPDGTDKAGEEEPLDGDCSDEEDPTVDCSLEENKDLPECQEENPCAETPNTPILHKGSCYAVGEICFADAGEPCTAGYIQPDGSCKCEPDESCPAGSEVTEPQYNANDVTKSGSFTLDGKEYTYEPCNPSVAPTEVVAPTKTCDNNAVNPDSCDQCENGEHPDRHVDSDCSKPLKAQDGNPGDACKLYDNTVGVVDKNGDCKRVGQNCSRSKYGYTSSDNCDTGLGFNTSSGIIDSSGDCVCNTPCEDPNREVYSTTGACRDTCKKGWKKDAEGNCTVEDTDAVCDNGATIESNCKQCPKGQEFSTVGPRRCVVTQECQEDDAYTDPTKAAECGKVECPQNSEKPYADSLDQCVPVGVTKCTDPNRNTNQDGSCADTCTDGSPAPASGLCPQPPEQCKNGATDYPNCVTCPSGQRINSETDQCEEVDCTLPENALFCGWVECEDGTMAPTLGDCKQETPCSDPTYAAANPLECGWVECPDGTFAETREDCKETPQECTNGATDYPACTTCPEGQSMDAENNCVTTVEPPETGGGDGSVGGGGGGMFNPFLAGISYTPQAVPEPPAPPQKDYMAELDNLIKRSLFEGMA